MSTSTAAIAADEIIPMERWGKDHWSTLAYIATVMVNNNGFQVGSDPRMKSNRRNFRVLAEQCPNPRRQAGGSGQAGLGMVMRPEHATVLRDGTVVENHDDWKCLEDFAAAGLFSSDGSIEPGVILNLSDAGQQLVSALSAHKANGGQYAQFDPASPARPAPRP